MTSYYSFGEKSAALLGLLLTSDGRITAYAYQRPGSGNPPPAMKPLFVSQPLALATAGLVSFRLALSPAKEGLLTIEPRGWPAIYEVSRLHFLGQLNPFGMDEIPYADLGGVNRSGGIPINRVFDGVFSYNPAAADSKQRATVTLTDVESGAQSVETISISAFDDNVNQIKGGLLIAIRVNEANRGAACATLEFTGGHAVQVTDAAGNLQAKTRLTLDC